MDDNNTDLLVSDEALAPTIVGSALPGPLLAGLLLPEEAAAAVRDVGGERVVLEVLVAVEALLGGIAGDQARGSVDSGADARHGARVQVRQ